MARLQLRLTVLLVGLALTTILVQAQHVRLNGVTVAAIEYFSSKICLGTQAAPTGGIDISSALMRFTSDCGTTLIGLSVASVGVGATPATAGALRLSNNTAINYRSAANDADKNLISSNGSDNVFVGDSSSSTTMNSTYTTGPIFNATTGFQINAAAATGVILRGNGTNYVATTATYPATVATGNVLYGSATNVISAATPASLVSTFPANQTGNATATLKMNGLGAAAAPCLITPATSGRVGFNISGQIVQSTTADGVAFKMTYGTTTPPANSAAAEGTVLTPLMTHTALTGALEETFSVTGVATGLSKVATWFDLQVAEVSGGTASITNVTCSAWEF